MTQSAKHAMSRRTFLHSVVASAAAVSLPAAIPSIANAYESGQPKLELFATSPHLWNGIAFTHTGRKFVAMPRWPGFADTPSVGEILSNGDVVPYPGNGWNDWKPDADATHAFVCINALNCFDGIHIWVVDTGSVPLAPAVNQKGAQKLVKIDTRTDKVVQIYTFDDILPPEGSLNDLRIGGDKIYMTESGIGSIVIIDTKTNKIARRLANDASTKADPKTHPKVGREGRIMTLPDGKPQITNADPIELSPDHRWLYYQPASGPLYRVPTAALNDPSITEEALSKKVEFVYDTATLGGTAMDDRGNLFLAEASRPRVSVLAPDGSLRTLLEDERLWGCDAMFITPDRYLYMPLSQVPDLQFVQGPGGQSHVTLPFKIYRTKLPTRYGSAIKSV